MTEEEVHLRLYDQFLSCIVDESERGEIRWSGMHPRYLHRADYVKDFNDLESYQKDVFFKSAARLKVIVETKFGGKDSFHGWEDRKWNIQTWMGVLLKLAKIEEPKNALGCYISKIKRTTKTNRPSIHFTDSK